MASQGGVTYANGYLFFMQGNTLMSQPFDLGRMQLTSEPIQVAEQVATNASGRPSQSVGVFGVSNGTLAYMQRSPDPDYQLRWVDRQGKTISTFEIPGAGPAVVLSPDGARGVFRDQNDLWTIEFVRGGRNRLTFLKSVGSNAIWSPDGDRVAFAAGTPNESGSTDADSIYERLTSGVGQERVLFKQVGEIYQCWVMKVADFKRFWVDPKNGGLMEKRSFMSFSTR